LRRRYSETTRSEESEEHAQSVEGQLSMLEKRREALSYSHKMREKKLYQRLEAMTPPKSETSPIARISQVRVKSGKMDALLQFYRSTLGPSYETMRTSGFQKAYLLLDREKNEACSVTVWENEASLEKNNQENVQYQKAMKVLPTFLTGVPDVRTLEFAMEVAPPQPPEKTS